MIRSAAAAASGILGCRKRIMLGCTPWHKGKHEEENGWSKRRNECNVGKGERLFQSSERFYVFSNFTVVLNGFF